MLIDLRVKLCGFDYSFSNEFTFESMQKFNAKWFFWMPWLQTNSQLKNKSIKEKWNYYQERDSKIFKQIVCLVKR